MSENASDRPESPLERFPCSSRVIGMISLAALTVAVVFMLIHGLSLGRGAALAGVVLLALGVWLTMVRPAIHLYRDHVLVRNALTDIVVPWHLVESVEVRQVLVIRTEERVVHGLAIGRSARRQLRSSRRDQRSGSGVADSSQSVGTFFGRVPFFSGSSAERTSSDPAGKGPAPVFGGEGVRYLDYADAVVHRIDNLADAHRRESEQLASVDRRWRRWEVGAVAAVAVAFVVLVVLAAVA